MRSSTKVPNKKWQNGVFGTRKFDREARATSRTQQERKSAQDGRSRDKEQYQSTNRENAKGHVWYSQRSRANDDMHHVVVMC